MNPIVWRGPAERLPRGLEVVVLAVIVVTFGVLADLFPYSGDDWAWGSQIGVDRLSTFFADYNGRYAGNLAVLVLTRSSAAVAVTMALAVAAAAFLVLHLARFRTLTGYVLVYALLLATPVDVWRQGIVWTSGFSNYMLATLSMLGVMVAVRSALTRTSDRPSHPVLRGVALFLLAFVGQLFIEHVTILVVAVTGGCVLWSLVTRRGVGASLWCLFVGAVLGAAAMFSNGAYRRAFSGGDGYQKIGSQGGSRTEQMLISLDTIIGTYGVALNTALNVVLLGLLGLVAARRATHASRATARLFFGAIGVVALVAAVLVVWWVPHDASALTSGGIASLVLVLVTMACAMVTVEDHEDRRLLLFVTIGFVLLIAPLLVVKPLGPRCFVPSYVLLLVAVAVLARVGLRRLGRVPARTSAYILVAAAAVIGVTAFVVRYEIYHRIDEASAARQATARTAVADGASSVVLRHLPYGGRWVHAPDPDFEPWETRYKLFYDLPASLAITVK